VYCDSGAVLAIHQRLPALRASTTPQSHQRLWQVATVDQLAAEAVAGGDQVLPGDLTMAVRRPLRPFWRQFSLRFTYVMSVLVKKY
jgi:hypothetical protein